MRNYIASLLILAAAAVPRAVSAQPSSDYPIQGVPFHAIELDDPFWSPRLETHRRITIPHLFDRLESTGRIENFDLASGAIEGDYHGPYYNDSDVFKTIEAAALMLALERDSGLESVIDGIIIKIAAAQEEDGYLYTPRTAGDPDFRYPGSRARWSDVGAGHELYNAGHMHEAAVAYYEATGKRALLDVAIRNADFICATFGPGRRLDPPGHQEIELALVKLYRLTGDEKYFETAKFFIDRRGQREGRRRLYGPYSQDHLPLTDQDEAVGHSVRAGYFYSGVADIAALTGASEYQASLDRLWANVAGRKMYITGGIGAQGGGEGFGGEYELPNRRAYSETCANIANGLWNERMFRLTGDARHVDILERVIYNSFLSGVALSGDRFFYPNPLESNRGGSRSAWFGTACCPPNVGRFMPSVLGFIYAHEADNLYVNLFVGGSAAIPLEGGDVRLTQETRYPWDGSIKMTIEPEATGEFALLVRIPGWARGEVVATDLYRFLDDDAGTPELRVNGESAQIELVNGYARIRREWRSGDTVQLNLPMPVRRIVAHDRVEDDAGKVALQRGPVVYCVEGADVEGDRVFDLVLADEQSLSHEFNADLLGGVEVIRGRAAVARRASDGAIVAGGAREFEAVPYYAWANRGRHQMTVWLARELDAARPAPAPTTASLSRVSASGGSGREALNDQLEPRNSIDHTHPFFHWWPRKGTLEWVEYHFAEPQTVSSTRVYWFDDTGIGECRLPASWRLLYSIGRSMVAGRESRRVRRRPGRL